MYPISYEVFSESNNYRSNKHAPPKSQINDAKSPDGIIFLNLVRADQLGSGCDSGGACKLAFHSSLLSKGESLYGHALLTHMSLSLGLAG